MKTLGVISPTREEFLATSDTAKVIPVTLRVLPDTITPVGLYQRLAADRPGSFLMESANQSGQWSRYSFIGVNSAATLTEIDSRAHWEGHVPAGVPVEGEPMEVLRATLGHLAKNYPAAGEDLPNLLSGMVGYIGWEASRYWLDLPNKPHDDMNLPDIALNLVTDLAIHDNRDNSVTLVANAINFNGETSGAEAAYDKAVQRLRAMLTDLNTDADAPVFAADPSWMDDDIASTVTHSWAEKDFLAAVEHSQQAIADGEVSQIVVSRRFTYETGASGFDIYRVLRTLNPSPYMFLYTFAHPETGEPYQVVGSSPEALLTVTDNTVHTHPIGGSIPRARTPEANRQLEAQLLADPKERVEHEMLVDLAKADIAPVCQPGTVHVPDFMFIERYSHILHLVSNVEGQLATDKTALDALIAAFPAGTLSGSPKVRSLELLDEWEPHARGIYGGVVGYFDLTGNMDMAITIRTVILAHGTAHVQAGAGIVAESVPEKEATETLTKATAPLRAVLAAEKLTPITDVTGFIDDAGAAGN